MKTFRQWPLLLFLFSTFFSCKKDLETKRSSQLSNFLLESELNGEDCTKKWFGLYANEIQTNDTITQRTIIKDGYAQLPAVNWYNYHTGLYYDIPKCHPICGDSLRFEVRVKNPSFGSGSVPDYEVAMQVFGTNKEYRSPNFAEIYFVSHSSYQVYNHIWIGSTELSNLPEMVHYFGDYETLVMEIKNNTLSIYREGVLVKSVDYSTNTKIGKVKRIGIGFKGSGYTDWVKLYNSYTGEQIMQEDFDVNGRSNVKWFQ